jgi:hypothetical protein
VLFVVVRELCLLWIEVLRKQGYDPVINNRFQEIPSRIISFSGKSVSAAHWSNPMSHP